MPRTVTFRADPERYPGLAKNPMLERALRIRYALEAGHTREEAAAIADQAMGRRARRRRGLVVGQGSRPAGKRTTRRPRV